MDLELLKRAHKLALSKGHCLSKFTKLIKHRGGEHNLHGAKCSKCNQVVLLDLSEKSSESIFGGVIKANCSEDPNVT